MQKIRILNSIKVKLTIEETIKQIPHSERMRDFNLFYKAGSDTENRTPVPGMRIPCPNH